MVYIIGGIVVVFCIFLAGFFIKKKYYRETDRLEEWKIDLTTRPVLDEMQKVKQLNMNGETEERFERWRSTWDEIVSVQLPNLEELLFDAEEYIDKYRFNKAKTVQADIKNALTEIEEGINSLLQEIQELVGSEEKNRLEIDNLKDSYRECKKTLLAHRHSFGNMEAYLEERLEETSKKFSQFEENTTNGNYLVAREIVLSINEQMEKTNKAIEMIPSLLMECKTVIPAQLNELKDGFKEMLSQGYGLEHIRVVEEVEKIEKELEEILSNFGQLELDEIQNTIDSWKERIDNIYNLLEAEVLAKQELNQQDKEILGMLKTARKLNNDLNNEFVQIQSSYHLQHSDMDIISKLAKRLENLFQRYDLIELKKNESEIAFSYLNDELLEVKGLLESIVSEQTAFADKLHALRKDELIARNQVKELKTKIAETIRLVSKSNVPGVPQDYKYLLEDAQDSIQQVIEKLNEKPLDIPVIQKFLEVAVLTVEKVTKRTDDLFEMVLLAEKVIQYGNRYRSKYPNVDKALKEAEEAFRSYEYKEAFEQAAATIEKIEPGALKRMEDLFEIK